MTAATLSRLPLSAGGAVAGSMARGGIWTLSRLIDLGYWGAARFMQAPVAISCVIAITGFSLLASANALFLQTSRHPAPLFFSAPHQAAAPSATKPVVPAMRPRPQPVAAIDNQTTGSLGTDATKPSMGTAEVMALQKKLAALSLFTGTPDGLFGRRTASAIKAFETKSGMKPRGTLTPQLLAAVLAAPMPAVEPLPTPSAVVAAAAPAGAPAQKPVQVASIAPTKLAQTMAGTPTLVPLAPIRRAPDPMPSTATDAAPLAVAPQIPTAAPAQPVALTAPAATSKPALRVVPVQTISIPAPTDDGASDDVPAPAADTDGGAMAMNNLPQAAAPAAPVTQVAVAPAPVAAAPALDANATPAQRLAAQMGTLPPAATPAVQPAMQLASTSSDPGDGAGSTDPALISKIQRGLASLGFLGQNIDGVPGEGTAKAIRNFEVFYDYKVTGLASPQLLNLLIQHGAAI